MADARECYHCKFLVEPGEAHDCWTTTEAALTEDLAEDLRDAWRRLRDVASELGEQRIYASHKSVMFARTHCYFYVRPGRSWLELCVFLGRTLAAPGVRKTQPTSRTKVAHFVRVAHRDQVEPPLTDWLAEAYEFAGSAASAPAPRPAAAKKKSAPRAASKKTAAKPRAATKTAARKSAAKKTTAKKSAAKPRAATNATAKKPTARKASRSR